MKSRKLIVFTVMVFSFFFVSIGFYERHEKKPMQPETTTFKIEFKSVKPVFAVSSDWDGVRGVASFAKSVSESIDSLIVKLSNTGLLSKTEVYTHNDGTYKMQFSPNSNTSLTSKGTGVTATYTHKFILWKASDDTKVLELFFDSNTDRTSGDGVVAVWWPKQLDATLQAGSGKIECTTGVVSSNNTMVCSWSQGPFVTSGIVNAAQVKVVNNVATSTVDFKAYARLTSTFCTDTRDYYALAFITKNIAPFYTTAEFSVAGNTPAAGVVLDSSGVLCAVDPNPRNFGFFNTNANAGSTGSDKYFVGDSSSVLPGTGYPSTASVDTLFAQMSTGSPSKTSVDALNGTPIDFLDATTAAPSF